MNRVFLVGNITADIYFDRFLIQGKKRSFLRLILMAERPRTVRNLRVVLDTFDLVEQALGRPIHLPKMTSCA